MVLARFPGYTLRTLMDEDAELITLLKIEAGGEDADQAW